VSGGTWFVSNVYKKVGNGSNTFWYVPLLGRVVLKDQFNRLFNLALDKNVSAKDKVSCCGLEAGCWSWRINLFVGM